MSETDSSISSFSSASSGKPTPGAPTIKWNDSDAHLIGRIIGTFILEDGEVYHVSQKTLDKNKRDLEKNKRVIARVKKLEKRNELLNANIAKIEERQQLIKQKSDLLKQVEEIDDKIEILTQSINTNPDGTIPKEEVARQLKKKFIRK